MAPPPGYVSYGTGPTPTQRVSRVGGLAKAISIVVVIAGIGSVVNALLQSSLRSDAEDFLAGNTSEDDFNSAVIASSAFSLVAALATLATLVLVMIWMYRITSNLRSYGHNTTWHPLFGVFGWFLPPGVLYVIPLLMLREQWSKSAAAPNAAAASASGRSGENPLLWVWWLFYGLLPLITLAFSTNTMFSGFGDNSTEAVAQRLVDANTAVTFVAGVGSLVAAVAWVLFVRQLTSRHTAMTGER